MTTEIDIFRLCPMVFDAYPNGAIAVFDHELRFLYVGGAVLPTIGLSPDGLQGRTVHDVFPLEVTDVVAPVYRSAIAGSAAEAEVSFQGRRFLVRTVPVPADVALGLVTVEDVTGFRETERKLSVAVETFRTAFDSAPIGMALVGLDGRFVEVNAALCEILGYPSDDLQRLTFQDITHPDDLHVDLAQAEQLARGEIDRYQMEKRYYDRRGHVVWAQLSGSVVRADSGEPVHFIAQIEDISDRKRREEELTRMARRDTVTGLLNRAVFDTDLEVYRGAAARYGDTTGLLLLDLDGFKRVNDDGGHEVGDALLAEVSQAIRRRVRMSDHVYRIGGDEFAVLVPHASEASLAPLASSIRDAVRSAVVHAGDRSFGVTVSIGSSTIGPGTEGTAMRDADAALYLEKHSGDDAAGWAASAHEGHVGG